MATCCETMVTVRTPMLSCSENGITLKLAVSSEGIPYLSPVISSICQASSGVTRSKVRRSRRARA